MSVDTRKEMVSAPVQYFRCDGCGDSTKDAGRNMHPDGWGRLAWFKKGTNSPGLMDICGHCIGAIADGTLKKDGRK